jgi:hypothetical protein
MVRTIPPVAKVLPVVAKLTLTPDATVTLPTFVGEPIPANVYVPELKFTALLAVKLLSYGETSDELFHRAVFQAVVALVEV